MVLFAKQCDSLAVFCRMVAKQQRHSSAVMMCNMVTGVVLLSQSHGWNEKFEDLF